MNKSKRYIVALSILSIILILFSLTKGSYPLSLHNIIDIILLKNTSTIQTKVFFTLRLPRVLMAFIAGFTLALSGAIYQIIFKNPLASPDLTGVASGSSFGAAICIVFRFSHPFSLTIGAFVFGVLSLLLVIILVKITRQNNISAYVLSGIIVSSLANAGLMLIKYMADPIAELATIEFWTMGSFSSITMNKFLVSISMGLIPSIILLVFWRYIIILSFGDEQAKYFGMNATVVRIMFLILSTWSVASVISITGVISFVGLIAPHIVYQMIHKRTGAYLFLSGLVGALLMLVGDILARILIVNQEIPISILTTLLSLPILIIWMYRQRGKIV